MRPTTTEMQHWKCDELNPFPAVVQQMINTKCMVLKTGGVADVKRQNCIHGFGINYFR